MICFWTCLSTIFNELFIFSFLSSKDFSFLIILCLCFSNFFFNSSPKIVQLSFFLFCFVFFYPIFMAIYVFNRCIVWLSQHFVPKKISSHCVKIYLVKQNYICMNSYYAISWSLHFQCGSWLRALWKLSPGWDQLNS